MKRPTGKFWLDTFFARKSMNKFPNQDLTGKTVVFTGGTDGLGRVAVTRYAEMGAHIVLLGRNKQKMFSVVEECTVMGYRGSISTVHCDISSLKQVRLAAEEVLEQCEKIDLLINCAGANNAKRQVTEEGYEMNFAVNYLGPVLLTELLLDRIKATESSRIICVTSATQEAAQLDFEDLQYEKEWSLFRSYSRAKLCLIMYCRNLASRVKEHGVKVNSLNPGYIRSNLSRDLKGFEQGFNILFGRLASPTWIGGERIIAASLDDAYDSASGQYIYEDMLLDPNKIALDDQMVSQLMQVTAHMTDSADIK